MHPLPPTFPPAICASIHPALSGTAATDDKLYVFGGCDDGGRLADLHQFDTISRVWKRLPDPPNVEGRGGAVFEAAPDGRSLWLVGGFAGRETNDILKFDLDSQSWTRYPSEWLRPRSVCASFSLGGAVFVLGGEVSPSDRGHEGAGGFASDMFGVNTFTGGQVHVSMTPTVRDSLPLARGWGGAATLSNDSAVLFGGLSGDDQTPERLNDAWLITVSGSES